MIQHTVEIVPDDLAALREKLDYLAAAGSEIISVMWQAKLADVEDQATAMGAGGSFVVVSRMNVGEGSSALDEREPALAPFIPDAVAS